VLQTNAKKLKVPNLSSAAPVNAVIDIGTSNVAIHTLSGVQ